MTSAATSMASKTPTLNPLNALRRRAVSAWSASCDWRPMRLTAALLPLIDQLKINFRKFESPTFSSPSLRMLSILYYSIFNNLKQLKTSTLPAEQCSTLSLYWTPRSSMSRGVSYFINLRIILLFCLTFFAPGGSWSFLYTHRVEAEVLYLLGFNKAILNKSNPTTFTKKRTPMIDNLALTVCCHHTLLYVYFA